MVKFSLGETIGSKVTTILIIIALLSIASNLLPIVTTVGNDLATLPLGGLFSSDVIPILIMIGIFITVVAISLTSKPLKR